MRSWAGLIREQCLHQSRKRNRCLEPIPGFAIIDRLPWRSCNGVILLFLRRLPAACADPYAPDNPFNPANRYDPGNPVNPANQYSPNNPFNPANEYNPANPLNPANRFNPTVPFEPLNRPSQSGR
jgi:hypothetical protein